MPREAPVASKGAQLALEIAERNEEGVNDWRLNRALGVERPDAYSPMLREYLTQRFAKQRAEARAWLALVRRGRWYHKALRRSAAGKLP